MSRAKMPRIIALVVALIAIATFFLPYISATKEYAETIETVGLSKAEQEMCEAAHISKSEMNNMSLFTYTKAYLLAGDLLYRDVTNAYIEGGLFASVGVLAILVALCALGKKPILMFIMNALMGGAFYLINWDVVDRRIMPDSNRVWGIAHVLYWPLVAILAVCAIWLFIGKRQDKKANN